LLLSQLGSVAKSSSGAAPGLGSFCQNACGLLRRGGSLSIKECCCRTPLLKRLDFLASFCQIAFGFSATGRFSLLQGMLLQDAAIETIGFSSFVLPTRDVVEPASAPAILPRACWGRAVSEGSSNTGMRDSVLAQVSPIIGATTKMKEFKNNRHRHVARTCGCLCAPRKSRAGPRWCMR
jgi:hypothetical protein